MAIRPRSVLVAVALVAALLCHLHRTPVVLAQPSAGADGEGIVLHGRVLAGDGSTTPLPGARVSVVADGRATAPVASDGEGRFTLSAPARDGWSLRVTKAGFAPADIVVARPAAEPIAIRLAPGAVITGHVVDERGAPVSGVTVHAWPERCPDACQTPVPLPVLAASARSATTDDRGEYRIGSLPAGTHEIWIGGSVPAFVADQLSGTGVPEPDARVRLGPGDATALSHVHPTTDVPAASARTGVRPGVIDRTGGSIRGRILDAAGRPIAGASVHVEEIDTAAARTGRSDTGGRYEVTGLPPGRFSLTVSRTGQPPVRLGQQHASQQGTPISLRAFETLDGVDVVLPRPGVITGRVVDLHGEPIEGATVRIWERRFAGGRVTLAPAGATLVRTDDRGHYRAHGLLPGTYYAMASDASMAPQSRTGLVVQGPASDPSTTPTDLRLLEAISGGAPGDGAPSVFHPAGASAADAVPVRIEPGLDGHGVDITFAPPPAAHVRGFVRDSTGQPSQGSVTLIVSARSGAPVMPARRVPIGPFGSFEFPFVAPGDYVAHATTTRVTLTRAGATDVLIRMATPVEFGMQFVTVTTAGAAEVSVRTSPGSRVRGRVVVEHDDLQVSRAGVVIGTIPADADRTPPAFQSGGMVAPDSQPRGVPDGDGTFEMTGLFGPRRFDLTRAPPGWYLKSATVGGIDAAEHPFVFDAPDQSYGEVLVTIARGGAIGGQVVDDRGTRMHDFSVVVFPTDPERWCFRSRYLKLARANQDGGFTVMGLPPGEYWVAAVDWIPGDATFGEWQAADVLIRLLPGARRVQVSDAQPAGTELRLMRASW